MCRSLLCAAALSLLIAVLLPARVAHADESGCAEAKLRALAHAVDATLRCSAQAAKRGETVDPACAGEVDASLAEAFADAQDRYACAADGELADVVAALHAFDLQLTSLLLTDGEKDRCAAAKLRAAARRARHELVCRRRGAAELAAPDPTCLDRAQTELADEFSRLDNGGTCATTGDAAAVEDLVADFLAFTASRIDGSADAPASSGLTAVVDGATIGLTWNAPHAGSGLTEALLLRRLNAAPAGPDDPAAAVVSDGAGEAAFDDLTALLPDTTTVPRVYHYAVYGCDTTGRCESGGSRTTLVPTVRQALVAGGYVIHWRHAAADVCADRLDLGRAATTSVPDWWKSCDSNCGTATARQLNDAGRNDSMAIGGAFNTLGIVVGRVISSEFCRNFETATLMDFGPAIEQSQEITYFVYDESSRCSDSYEMLGVVPTPGTNTALIGHAGFSPSCPTLSSLAWGEAAIFKPDGLGAATFIERVAAPSWLSLP